jgi:hypothetical protein
MLLTAEKARLRVCVYQVGKRSRYTLRQRTIERFWGKFFPWFYRKVLYRHAYCLADGCMHWHFIDGRERHGYCTLAGRHALMQMELDGKKVPRSGQ